MSIVIQYDRKTGKILKVDNHPEWEPRAIDLGWYKRHPKERIEGAGWLTPHPDDNWDGHVSEWIVRVNEQGIPRLIRKEDYESEIEIEKALLNMVHAQVSRKAQRLIKKKIERKESRLMQIPGNPRND